MASAATAGLQVRLGDHGLQVPLGEEKPVEAEGGAPTPLRHEWLYFADPTWLSTNLRAQPASSARRPPWSWAALHACSPLP